MPTLANYQSGQAVKLIYFEFIENMQIFSVIPL